MILQAPRASLSKDFRAALARGLCSSERREKTLEKEPLASWGWLVTVAGGRRGSWAPTSQGARVTRAHVLSRPGPGL